MTLDQSFEIAAGSVAGRDHRASLLNSHDAYYWEAHPGVMVAVVCDGCGSGKHSEVGAKLGARTVVKQVLRWYHEYPEGFNGESINRGLGLVRRSVLSQLQLLADQMGGSFSETVSEYFLFTVLGTIMTPEDTFVFRAGDGILTINGRPPLVLAPFDNKPEYLAYGLVQTEEPIKSELRNVTYERTKDVTSIFIGTDGARDLLLSEKKKIPGKDEVVGPLEQFWNNDVFFKNPFAMQRRLNLINRTVTKADFDKKVVHEEHGHLTDDTTVLVIRRRK